MGLFDSSALRALIVPPWFAPSVRSRVYLGPYSTVGGLDSTPHVWVKPRRGSWLFGFGVAGGGSGAKGTSGGDNTNRIGGGGGASGNWIRFQIPFDLVPDVLYFYCGRGGARATVAGAGNPGTDSYIGTAQYLVAAETLSHLCNSFHGNAGNLGVGGSSSGTGALLSPWMPGNTSSASGQAGATAITGNNPGTDLSATGPVTSGAAGGSTNNANQVGGTILDGTTATRVFVSLPRGISSPQQATGPGSHGIPLYAGGQLVFFGGTGGASVHDGTGGAGGDGSYGAGGGGGGAGITGGNGGAGGDGFWGLAWA